MPDRYPIPAAFHRVEQNLKRSRFIASVDHAPDIAAARDFVSRIKEEFPDATHNCWAFNAGPPGDTALVGLSDDGELSGTAGKPMLNALLHSGVGEIVVVVTRYFGGIKLGTGGLVRAYTGLVNLGLEDLSLRERVTTVTLTVIIPYPAVTLFKRMLSEFEAEIQSESFADQAGFAVVLPEEQRAGFAAALAELTGGKAEICEK